jgi:hypothetical protein
VSVPGCRARRDAGPLLMQFLFYQEMECDVPSAQCRRYGDWIGTAVANLQGSLAESRLISRHALRSRHAVSVDRLYLIKVY